ncbi:ASCH domain-containing protein [Streptomyces luteolus]|uniref:ASCH domain-containing protein n=1 Tax=Streptomyces luteolus TaxID=3043615 RepID=A0ABT6SYQ0_9ACTN|nr:ASCH domain-containing protein [Streptomyces sp. B-S-A12]MDI3420719.1 ASCH domain-containing protein [Streptomyces sp. B-S-A12]
MSSAIPETFPTLTISQPYAGLIMASVKDVESRSWATKYRGPLAVHAGMQRHRDDPGVPVTASMRVQGRDEALALDEVYGALLGWVTLVDVVTDHPSQWAQESMFHWVLAEPRLLDEALPMQGKQGLWRYQPAPSPAF